MHPASPRAGGGDEEDDGGEENIFRDMTFDEVLEDLNARFLVNLPKEEMTLVRIYWQAEQAHWFYEDYLRPLNPLLPALSQRQFTQLIISSSPIYSNLAGDSGIDYDSVWAEYIAYKSMVPCCGAILINQLGDKCIMVRGWKSSAGWSFPRGKINLGEAEVDCAIREVEEETGFDCTGLINSKDRIQTQVNAQMVTMFLIKDIPEDTVFEAQTRKEIGAIEWVNFTELPTWTGKRPKKTDVKGKRFYNVTPFVGPLKRWLQEKGVRTNNSSKKQQPQIPSQQNPNSNHRDLQPYFDPSIATDYPTAARAVGAPTLDHLFQKFVHKQEEDLVAPTQAKTVGSDNKAGLERLFGGLVPNSAKDHHVESKVEETHEEGEGDDEEDALASLLGAVAVAPPPALVAPKSAPMTSDNSNKLLAMLNSKPRSNEEPSKPPQPAIKPHQASLLSMLSPGKQAPQMTASTSSSSIPGMQPIQSDDEDRKRRQQALLESTFAGLVGLPSSASQTTVPASDSTTNGSANYAGLSAPPVDGVDRIPTASSSNTSRLPFPPPPYEQQIPIPILPQQFARPPQPPQISHAAVQQGQHQRNLLASLMNTQQIPSQIPVVQPSQIQQQQQQQPQPIPSHIPIGPGPGPAPGAGIRPAPIPQHRPILYPHPPQQQQPNYQSNIPRGIPNMPNNYGGMQMQMQVPPHLGPRPYFPPGPAPLPGPNPYGNQRPPLPQQLQQTQQPHWGSHLPTQPQVPNRMGTIPVGGANVLQPVPRPAGAAGNLLAMINGGGGVGPDR